MEKDYIQVTAGGRPYIKTTDFFKIDKVITLIKKLRESDLYANLEANS